MEEGGRSDFRGWSGSGDVGVGLGVGAHGIRWRILRKNFEKYFSFSYVGKSSSFNDRVYEKNIF